jgi:hypothetical protein
MLWRLLSYRLRHVILSWGWDVQFHPAHYLIWRGRAYFYWVSPKSAYCCHSCAPPFFLAWTILYLSTVTAATMQSCCYRNLWQTLCRTASTPCSVTVPSPSLFGHGATSLETATPIGRDASCTTIAPRFWGAPKEPGIHPYYFTPVVLFLHLSGITPFLSDRVSF